MRLRRSKGIADEGYDSEHVYAEQLGAAFTAFAKIWTEGERISELEKRLNMFPSPLLVPPTDNKARLERAYNPDEREVVIDELLQRVHNLTRAVVDFEGSFSPRILTAVKGPLDDFKGICTRYLAEVTDHYRRRYHTKTG